MKAMAVFPKEKAVRSIGSQVHLFRDHHRRSPGRGESFVPELELGAIGPEGGCQHTEPHPGDRCRVDARGTVRKRRSGHDPL